MRVLKFFGKFLLAIISFVLCVALFASTLITMLVADVKVATNKDNLQNLLNQTLSAPAQQTTLRPLTAAAGAGFEFDLSSGNLSDSLVEYAFESIQEMFGDEMPVTIDQVKEFVEASTIKEFISEKSASIISDIYTGENTTTLTSDEIINLINENKDLIKEHFDIEIPQEQLDEIKTAIEEIPEIQQIQEQGITSLIVGDTTAPDEETDSTQDAPDLSDKWYGNLPGIGGILSAGGSSNIMNNPVALALEIVRFYTSDAVLWLCIGVCAALIGLLFLCAWNKPYKAMIKSGITLFIAGGIFLTPTLIAWLAVSTWTGLFSFLPVVGTVARFILMLTGGVCGSVTGLGVALIAGGIVVKVLMRKKAKKAAELAAAPVEETAAAETGIEEITTEEITAQTEQDTADEVAPAETEEAAEETPVAQTEETPAEEAVAEETV